MSKAAGTDDRLTALVRLHLFPRSVLGAMPRGGKRGRAQTRSILTKRLLFFSHQQCQYYRRHALGQCRKFHASMPKLPTTPTSNLRRRIQALVAAGNLSKAAKELVPTVCINSHLQSYKSSTNSTHKRRCLYRELSHLRHHLSSARSMMSARQYSISRPPPRPESGVCLPAY